MPSPNPKPLGQKSYGFIPHLPGSRQGRDDKGLTPAQAAICTVKARDKHDLIIVQEKLDGANVSVANVGGQLLALSRSGHLAAAATYEHLRMFDWWLQQNLPRFDFLQPGERLCGEWLALAHGTRYTLPHEPFVPFDLMTTHRVKPTEPAHTRTPYDQMIARLDNRFTTPALLHRGGPLSIEAALALLDPKHHGAQEEIEGAVCALERTDPREGPGVDFLAKFVRATKVDGHYLPEIGGGEAVWNWKAW